MSRIQDVTAYRVYQQEWVTVYPSQSTGSNGHDECGEVFSQKYLGRVRDEDVRIRETSGGHHALELFLPNLQGEFIDPDVAEELRSGRGAFAVVVGQGSEQEQELRDYGRRMQRAD